jgi:hypothetical protein
MHAPTEESTHSPTPINMVFANRSKEHVCSSEETKQTRQYSIQFVEDTQGLCRDGKMVILKDLQLRAVSWYYHYLQHHGQAHLERRYTQQCIGQV